MNEHFQATLKWLTELCEEEPPELGQITEMHFCPEIVPGHSDDVEPIKEGNIRKKEEIYKWFHHKMALSHLTCEGPSFLSNNPPLKKSAL